MAGVSSGTAFVHEASRRLPPELEEARRRIVEIARGYGLDFFDTIFVMCSYDEINMLAAYGGFPIRYPHWRFGMEYLEMDKGYEYGLQKIYEMVINTDPAYAYLMDNNTIVDQKLVMAHVLAHVDFFKNNHWFRHTDRKMLDRMANHAARVRRMMERHGQDEVERWIDVALSLENLIDPHGPHIVRHRPDEEDDAAVQPDPHRLPARKHMDRYINPPEVLEARRRAEEEARARRSERFPPEPVRDVLAFLIQHAPLPEWKRRILEIVREEALYFAPQAQTKIMNEGWATYWHTHMMTHDILTAAEVVDYADHHAGTVATRPGQLNPYKLGVELYRDIEWRWNRGQHGKAWQECDDERRRRDWDDGSMAGRRKIFEVRATHNDVTFVDTFLTPEFVERHGIFTYEYDRRRGGYVMASRDFHAVKQKLLFLLTNRGQPRVAVVDANHANRGELVLRHDHEGVDVELGTAERVLGNLARVWGRPVHLETILDDRPTVLHHDGETFGQEARGGRRRRR